MEQQYTKKEVSRRVFAISAQHYAFVVNAFVSLVKEYDKNKYEFTLRESRTYDIIEDVQKGRSELGVLFLSKFNRQILCRTLDHAGLTFTSLFTAKPHVFISRHNPLAKKDTVTLKDLHPYPRLTYEQGLNNSFYFSEEPHSVEAVSYTHLTLPTTERV